MELVGAASSNASRQRVSNLANLGLIRLFESTMDHFTGNEDRISLNVIPFRALPREYKTLLDNVKQET
jgi:hypothetical protein